MDSLFLESIICKEKVKLSDILNRIDNEIKECKLGYTPLVEDMELCHAELYDGADDYRFFYMGRELENIENEKLYFPEFSHA